MANTNLDFEEQFLKLHEEMIKSRHLPLDISVLCLANVVFYAGGKPQLAYPDNFKKLETDEDFIDLDEEEPVNSVDGLNDFKKCVFKNEHDSDRKLASLNFYAMRNKTCFMKNKDFQLKQIPPNGNLKLSIEEMKVEKEILKSQYDHPPVCNEFEIIYEKSKKFNKKKRSFKCTFQGCGKKFAKTWNLFDHLRIHTGEKPFACQLCGRGFAQNGNLTKHMRIHEITSKKSYSCTECDKSYTEKYNLKLHCQKTHNIDII